MFKNREVSIHVSKNKKNEDDDTPVKEEMDFETKMATAIYVTKQVTYRVGGVVAAYIILDTWRQTQIAKNTTNVIIND